MLTKKHWAVFISIMSLLIIPAALLIFVSEYSGMMALIITFAVTYVLIHIAFVWVEWDL